MSEWKGFTLPPDLLRSPDSGTRLIPQHGDWGEPLDSLYEAAPEPLVCRKCVVVMTPAEYCHRGDHGRDERDSVFCSACGDFVSGLSEEHMGYARRVEELFQKWDEGTMREDS